MSDDDDLPPIRVMHLGEHGTCSRCGSVCPTCASFTEEPPGRPLPSGFDYRPSSEFSELQLSDEARKRIEEKMDSVAEAQRIAAETGDSKRYGESAMGSDKGSKQ